MKLIDRYILRTFLVPLAYCLIAFSMLYVLFDLFENLSHFMEARTEVSHVVSFYLILLPSTTIYIVPVSLLLAVLYSLSQLTRNSELTAMRACGINIYRLMVPFVVVGTLASLVTSVINEYAAPNAGFRANQFIQLQRQKGDPSIFIEHNLPYTNMRGGRVWHIHQFDTRPPDYPMTTIRVLQQQDGGGEEEITAKSAQWLGDRWWFRDVTIQRRSPRGDPIGAPYRLTAMEMRDFNETPATFLNERKDPEFLAAREIRDYIRRHNLSDEAITRYVFDMHARLAMPWTCLIVVLIGIPFGSHTGRKGVLAGIALILLLFFAYYALISLGVGLGKRGIIPPGIAAWSPHFVFAGIGLLMTSRMR